MSICKLCKGEKIQSLGDTISLDENTLYTSAEGEFGELCLAAFVINYCPYCGKKLGRELG